MADSVWGSASAASVTAATVRPRHSAVVRVTHWITTLSFLALLVTGVEILISHPRFYWGEAGNALTPPLFKLPIPASRATVPTGYGYVLPDQNGWSRYLHFQSAWVAVLTGLLYVGFGLFSGHFRQNLLPARDGLSQRGIWMEIARHLRFRRPGEEEAWSYNVLQRLTYLLVVFVLFPLVIWTGLAMSPAIASGGPGGGHRFRRPAVRANDTLLRLHIPGAFPFGPHRDGRSGRVPQPDAGDDHRPPRRAWRADMKMLSRRRLITAGLAGTAGASGLAVAARLAQRYGLVPPDGGGLFGPGETLTYATQRLLTRHSLAREFRPDQISKPPFPNHVDPLGEAFSRLQQGAFTGWRLAVDGMVARPASFSLAEIKSFPRRSQVTHLACEEGWSYIAEWTGVPLSHILDLVGTLPQARYVVYRSFQSDWWESIDMDDALHPQTLVTHSMNGGDLPVAFGGPLRLRVPRQLGYKSLKYITRLTITDSLKRLGKGLGSAAPEGGYAWYAGI